MYFRLHYIAHVIGFTPYLTHSSVVLQTILYSSILYAFTSFTAFLTHLSVVLQRNSKQRHGRGSRDAISSEQAVLPLGVSIVLEGKKNCSVIYLFTFLHLITIYTLLHLIIVYLRYYIWLLSISVITFDNYPYTLSNSVFYFTLLHLKPIFCVTCITFHNYLSTLLQLVHFNLYN